jgi:hypothetical protein
MSSEDKKQHRIGWFRSFYYYMGWEYESENDKPKEEDVKKKQVLMKQVGLSKLKMNKVIIEPSVPFDLQKIETNDKKVPLPLDDNKKKKTKRISTKKESVKENEIEKKGIRAPPSSPINMSQKQKSHKISYTEKLNMLKNL